MDISGTLEIITEKGPLISVGEIITIGVALLSFIGVIISTIIATKTSKKIHEQSTEFQNEWNQKTIDANLIAQARIEWIQNVRKTTSQLLVHYFAMLNASNIERLDQELLASQEQNELLILYFGNEKESECNEIFKREILLNRERNSGKNDMLVRSLIELSKEFGEYVNSIKSDKTNALKKAVEDARREMYAHVKMVEIGQQYIEEAEEYLPVEEAMYQVDDVRALNKAQSDLKQEIERVKKLQQELILIRDAVRTYLKIEWEIAKQGK